MNKYKREIAVGLIGVASCFQAAFVNADRGKISFEVEELRYFARWHVKSEHCLSLASQGTHISEWPDFCKSVDYAGDRINFFYKEEKMDGRPDALLVYPDAGDISSYHVWADRFEYELEYLLRFQSEFGIEGVMYNPRHDYKSIYEKMDLYSVNAIKSIFDMKDPGKALERLESF